MKEALLTAAAHEKNPLNFREDNKKPQATTCSCGYISTNSSNWKSLKSLLIDEYKFKYSTFLVVGSRKKFYLIVDFLKYIPI